MYHFFNSDKESERKVASEVHQYLWKKACENDYLCKQLFNAIDSSIESLKVASDNVLKQELQKKGRKITEVEFRDKQESQGKQFGIKVNYTYKDQDNEKGNITYYVKAHDKYHISSSKKPTGQGPSVPDLKELLVYKILEHSGFGSKSHFIFNPFSRAGLFIATQDAAFTKFSRDIKDKSFTTAENQQNSNEFAQKIEKESQQIGSGEEKIKATTLDILARTMRLTDLNMDNFGYVNTKELQNAFCPEKNKLKIIDFKVREDANNNVSETIYHDFLSGNSQFSYTGFTGKLLKNRTKQEKVQLGNEVLENHLEKPRGNKKSFEDAIQAAFQDVQDYINSEPQRTEKLGITPSHLAELDKYKTDITLNYIAYL